ncbi:MAG TPA: hydroxymethylbilane synthase [Desulfurobacteriaceae bacterium]|nr:hydroxymethylbilane synthase [Desulfurobacteriaceae bacterium]
MKTLRIATRKSKLALWQANYIAKLIKEKYPDINIELVKIVTKGDKILDVPLAKIGGKGLFTKEIEEALLDNRADLAVHSMKDVPTQLPENLEISVVSKREDPRDALIIRKDILEKIKKEKDISFIKNPLDLLPKNAIVGTSSLRRKALLKKYRKDLIIKDLRGNVDTRLRKLKEGQYDAIILAGAGLKRLGLEDEITAYLPTEIFIPAICQGILGIETRVGDKETLKYIEHINDKKSYYESLLERAFLEKVEGGCQVPLGCHAQTNLEKGTIKAKAFIADLEGKVFLLDTIEGEISKAQKLGEKLADSLLNKGGKEILQNIYEKGK